jgi:hypothetical protein
MRSAADAVRPERAGAAMMYSTPRLDRHLAGGFAEHLALLEAHRTGLWSRAHWLSNVVAGYPMWWLADQCGAWLRAWRGTGGAAEARQTDLAGQTRVVYKKFSKK